MNTKKNLNALFRAIINPLFPNHCLICHKHVGENFICASCDSTLPRYAFGCRKCGLILSEKKYDDLCAHCFLNPPPFDHTFSLFEYKPPISNWIWALKFNHDLSIAQLFAQHWIARFNQFYTDNHFPELIIPVPLHFSRLKERGFNQALEIAKPVGKFFGIPIDTKTCIRIKNTQAQSSLPAQKRKHNVNNAFGLSYSINAKHIAILDDVMTTGNTVTEIADLFKKVGVEKIDVWCCARARLH